MTLLEMVEVKRAQVDKAHATVTDLCERRIGWRMSIPAQPETDPDLVIARALRVADVALSALKVLTEAHIRYFSPDAYLGGMHPKEALESARKIMEVVE